MSMATEYRDYGITTFRSGGVTASPSIVTLPNSQVYYATHDNNGLRLPYRYRSFISFSFGGRRIEDFNLIATVSGDRMTRKLTGDFEDLTSSYDVLDGQFYHSTHFRTNSISFHLATDGINQQMLEDFLAWFAPGKTAELILAEHPNRGIQARISEPPEMEMLPFEQEISMTISGLSYTTSITNYKGEIELSFVMDEPFWYSIINIFGTIDSTTGNYLQTWEGVDLFGDSEESKQKLKDVLKIVYEDGIPLYNMITSPMLFGSDVYAASGGRPSSLIAIHVTENEYNNSKNVQYHGQGYYNDGQTIQFSDAIDEYDQPIIFTYYKGACVEDAAAPTHTQAVIAGAYVASTTNNSISIPVSDNNSIPLYLYYCGTAPSAVKLTFSLQLEVDQSSKYIKTIFSKRLREGSNLPQYNTITFESVDKQELRLTTPNFLTSYNNVIYLIKNIQPGTALETVRGTIRDEIRHPIIRKNIINLLNKLESTGYTTYNNDVQTKLITQFPKLIDEQMVTFILDSKTGEATANYNYLELDRNGDTEVNTAGTIIGENVGDMLQSNNIMLKNRNVFAMNATTGELNITAWTNERKDYSYQVYHDFPVPMTNVSIEYRNMYL